MKVSSGISSLIVIILVGCAGCRYAGNKAGETKQEIKGDIIVFHAGSLAVPFTSIAEEFEAAYPGTNVLLEPAGSVACARKITDLKKPCDIMASSDYKVIEELLIPEYTSWHIPFASNEMVIAYTDKSRSSAIITAQNWPTVLLEEEISYGRADPNSDPCGYRTVMSFQLAAKYYDQPGLDQRLSAKDVKHIRPKEVDLLALLEVGEIDYIFIYKSVAVQHQLKYIELPREINLEDPAMDEHYGQATVRINASEPGQFLTIKGEAMIYSFTRLKTAPNPLAAEAFMAFLLEKNKGLKIMEQSGQRPVVPYPSKYYQDVPSGLKKFVSKME